MNLDMAASQFDTEEAQSILEFLYATYHNGRSLDDQERQYWLSYLTRFGFLGLAYVLKGILDSEEMRNRALEELQGLWMDKLGRAPSEQDITDYLELLRSFRERGKQEVLSKIALAEEVSQQASELMRDGRLLEAQQLLESALPTVIPTYRFWHEHGLSLYRQGRFDDAISSYKQAIELNTQNDQFLFWSCEDMKWAYDELAKQKPDVYATALKYYQDVKEKYPNKWIVWHECGWMAWKAGRQEEAISYYHQAIDLNQDDTWGWSCTDLWCCYVEAGRQSDGYDYFCKMTEARPHLWGAWHTRAWVEGYDPERRNLTQAINSYRQAVNWHPDRGWFWSWQDLGCCLREDGQFADAYAAHERASEIGLDNWDAWYGRGQAAERMESWDKALDDYLKAIRLNPDSADSWRGLGECYRQKGQYISAWEAYRKALHLDPNLKEAEMGKDKLKLGGEPLIELHDLMSDQMDLEELEKTRFRFILNKIIEPAWGNTSAERASGLIALCSNDDQLEKLIQSIRAVRPGLIPLAGGPLASPKPELSFFRKASLVRREIDFGIITIREDEFEAVLRRFPPEYQAKGRRYYSINHLPLGNGKYYSIAVVRCPEQGVSEAQNVTHDLITDLDPQCLLLVGIAGAVPEHEFTLGDVIAATRLLDFCLQADLQGHPPEFAISGGPMHKSVQALLANLKAMDSQLQAWNDEVSIGMSRPPVELQSTNFYGDEDWQLKVKAALTKHFGGSSKPRQPIVTTAAIASSNRLVKDTETLKQWQQAARHIKAVEMELAGVYSAARQIDREYPILAIRGISDIVGFNRHPDWTTYACNSAAAFAYALIRTGFIEPKS